MAEVKPVTDIHTEVKPVTDIHTRGNTVEAWPQQLWAGNVLKCKVIGVVDCSVHYPADCLGPHTCKS